MVVVTADVVVVGATHGVFIVTHPVAGQVNEHEQPSTDVLQELDCDISTPPTHVIEQVPAHTSGTGSTGGSVLCLRQGNDTNWHVGVDGVGGQIQLSVHVDPRYVAEPAASIIQLHLPHPKLPFASVVVVEQSQVVVVVVVVVVGPPVVVVVQTSASFLPSEHRVIDLSPD